jgi:hypothetical protein
MSRISDHSLIQVADLDINMTFGIRYRAEVAYVTVSTYPHCRATRQLLDIGSFKPFVELAGIAADVCMRRARHLQALSGS